MEREEFLRGLGQSLSGHVSQTIVQENLNYYDGYIRQEVQKGRTEEEVIEEIGSPRLIAKTIIEASGGSDDGFEETGQTYDSYDSGYGQTIYEDDRDQRNRGGFHIYDFSSGWRKYALIGTVLLVIFFILMIVGGLLSLLMPFLVPLCIIWILWNVFNGMRR